MAFNGIIPFIFARSSQNNCMYILCLMLCLFAPDYQTDHAHSKSYNAYYILFIFIDNTYTCTYAVSKLFAPRTMNYIQVVLPVNMWYVLQSITNGAMKITDACLCIKKNLSLNWIIIGIYIYKFKISCNPQVKKLRCS